MGFMLPGDLFGYVDEVEYGVTAEALCDSFLVRFSRTQFRRLAETEPQFLRELGNQLCRELSAAQEHLMMLGRETARERTASFLVALAKRQAIHQGCRLETPMGRLDLADYLGLTIETVCRCLTDMERLGLIEINGRTHIVIKNWHGLEQVACDNTE